MGLRQCLCGQRLPTAHTLCLSDSAMLTGISRPSMALPLMSPGGTSITCAQLGSVVGAVLSPRPSGNDSSTQAHVSRHAGIVRKPSPGPEQTRPGHPGAYAPSEGT